MSVPIIIDTDPGVDDFLAILMALRAPELDLKGLTTVGGNTSLENATANALRALESEGRSEIPVAAGSAEALARPFSYAGVFHGDTGLAMELPQPEARPVAEEAVEWMRRRLEASAAPLTVLPVGPLTNMARLVAEHPKAACRIQRMIIMGGALDCPGNVTEFAEFNTWNDPEAARAVFRSGIPCTLIGLDVCSRVAFTRENIRAGSGAGRSMMDAWFDAHPDLTEFALCDPLAVAVAIDPSLVTTEPVSVEVDISGGPARGRTSRGAIRGAGGPLIDVALRVDAEKALRLILGLAL